MVCMLLSEASETGGPLGAGGGRMHILSCSCFVFPVWRSESQVSGQMGEVRGFPEGSRAMKPSLGAEGDGGMSVNGSLRQTWVGIPPLSLVSSRTWVTCSVYWGSWL